MPLVNYSNAQRPMTARELFEHHAERSRTAGRVAHQHARAVGDVFGRALFHAVAEKLEDVTEHAYEACHYAEKALAERDSDVAALVAENERLRVALSTAISETSARFRKAHKPTPAWVDDGRSLLRIVADGEEPF